MNKKKISFFIANALCGMLLTACGGSDLSLIGSGYDDIDLNGGGSGAGGKNSSATSGVGQIEPTVFKFLTDMANQGQQNNPIVASINNDGIGAIDRPFTEVDKVRFNQPGILSEICSWGGNCVDQSALDKIEDLREQAGKTKDEAEKARLENWAKSIEKQFPKDGLIAARDVNNVIVVPKILNTVDWDYFSNASRDAGVLKIDKKRTSNGLENYSGTIDRHFNGVWGFLRVNLNEPGKAPTLWLNSFFRNPSVAGWRYQTFGNFFSTQNDQLLGLLRGQNIGYQSIGKITEVLPPARRGKVTYEGISHAYYNTDQVTSHNKIDVDFASKSLSYNTQGSAILHTIEGTDHVIEERPDLNVSGSASWSDVNRFKGDVKAANGLTGKIEGQFYGPNAEEVGGVYGLQGNAAGKWVNYVGGFGAKRPMTDKEISTSTDNKSDSDDSKK